MIDEAVERAKFDAWIMKKYDLDRPCPCDDCRKRFEGWIAKAEEIERDLPAIKE